MVASAEEKPAANDVADAAEKPADEKPGDEKPADEKPAAKDTPAAKEEASKEESGAIDPSHGSGGGGTSVQRQSAGRGGSPRRRIARFAAQVGCS